MDMFTPRHDSVESVETVGRTFIWNEPDSPGQLSRSSSQSTSSYCFTRSGLRTPSRGSQRPSTPLPPAHLTPRDITPKFCPAQIYPGGRGPSLRRGSRGEINNRLQLAPKRQFIFEDIDESVQEEQTDSPFAPELIDENRNKVELNTPSSSSSSIGNRTKTFIFDEKSLQVESNGYHRPSSVESIRLEDPRSPLLTSREVQKLCIGKKPKKGLTQNLGVVKGMFLCNCNCSTIRSKNRVGCLSDQYEEM